MSLEVVPHARALQAIGVAPAAAQTCLAMLAAPGGLYLDVKSAYSSAEQCMLFVGALSGMGVNAKVRPVGRRVADGALLCWSHTADVTRCHRLHANHHAHHAPHMHPRRCAASRSPSFPPPTPTCSSSMASTAWRMRATTARCLEGSGCCSMGRRFCSTWGSKALRCVCECALLCGTCAVMWDVCCYVGRVRCTCAQGHPCIRQHANGHCVVVLIWAVPCVPVPCFLCSLLLS